jgi:anti-sigma factor RsiW
MSASVHLSEEQIQGLADGTLRGPEGFEAREHADSCAECSAELAMYGALVQRLTTLQDPAVPPDFTSDVLVAVQKREHALVQRRHTLLAAIPAAAVGIFAVLGWALSAAPSVHVDQLLEAWTVGRHVVSAIIPVVDAARLPIALGAFAFCAAVLFVLARALRGTPQPATASS